LHGLEIESFLNFLIMMLLSAQKECLHALISEFVEMLCKQDNLQPGLKVKM